MPLVSVIRLLMNLENVILISGGGSKIEELKNVRYHGDVLRSFVKEGQGCRKVWQQK